MLSDITTTKLNINRAAGIQFGLNRKKIYLEMHRVGNTILHQEVNDKGKLCQVGNILWTKKVLEGALWEEVNKHIKPVIIGTKQFIIEFRYQVN